MESDKKEIIIDNEEQVRQEDLGQYRKSVLQASPVDNKYLEKTLNELNSD